MFDNAYLVATLMSGAKCFRNICNILPFNLKT